MPQDDEQENLIQRISASAPFLVAPKQIELLKFLFRNKDKGLMAKEIEELHYRYPPTSSQHNPAHTRERIADLKERLRKYEKLAPNERLKCEPVSTRGDGFKLEFRSINRTATELFWLPHLELPEHILVVGNT